MPETPDVRTAARVAAGDVERRLDACPVCGATKAHGSHSRSCSWLALIAALAVEPSTSMAATLWASRVNGVVVSAFDALYETLVDEGDHESAWEDAVVDLRALRAALAAEATEPTGAEQ